MMMVLQILFVQNKKASDVLSQCSGGNFWFNGKKRLSGGFKLKIRQTGLIFWKSCKKNSFESTWNPKLSYHVKEVCPPVYWYTVSSSVPYSSSYSSSKLKLVPAGWYQWSWSFGKLHWLWRTDQRWKWGNTWPLPPIRKGKSGSSVKKNIPHHKVCPCAS